MTRLAAAPEVLKEPLEADADTQGIVQRPDGWYWLAEDGRQEIGPFASQAEALADLQSAQEGSEPGALLREAEKDLGVEDWIDPETQELAEDHTPHIEDR